MIPLACRNATPLRKAVDKKKIVLPEPIKTLGTHEVPVKLHKDVTAALKVVVAEA